MAIIYLSLLGIFIVPLVVPWGRWLLTVFTVASLLLAGSLAAYLYSIPPTSAENQGEGFGEGLIIMFLVFCMLSLATGMALRLVVRFIKAKVSKNA